MLPGWSPTRFGEEVPERGTELPDQAVPVRIFPTHYPECERPTRNLLTKVVFVRIINVDMPPLTSPDRPLNPVFWRFLLLLACVLVFSFALHAKVAVYDHGSQPQPSTSSKLWLTGLRTELPSTTSLISLFWLATFMTGLISWRFEERYHALCGTVARESRRQQYLHRFLRPPPLR